MAVLKGLCSVNFGAPGSGHVASPWLWHSGYPVKLSFSGVARVAVCVSRVSHYYAKHPQTAATLGNQWGDDLSGVGLGYLPSGQAEGSPLNQSRRLPSTTRMAEPGDLGAESQARHLLQQQHELWGPPFSPHGRGCVPPGSSVGCCAPHVWAPV